MQLGCSDEVAVHVPIVFEEAIEIFRWVATKEWSARCSEEDEEPEMGIREVLALMVKLRRALLSRGVQARSLHWRKARSRARTFKILDKQYQSSVSSALLLVTRNLPKWIKILCLFFR